MTTGKIIGNKNHCFGDRVKLLSSKVQPVENVCYFSLRFLTDGEMYVDIIYYWILLCVVSGDFPGEKGLAKVAMDKQVNL